MRTRKKIAIAFTVLTFVLAVLWVWLDVTGKQIYEAELERIRKEGGAATFQELMATATPPTPGVGAGGRMAEFLYLELGGLENHDRVRDVFTDPGLDDAVAFMYDPQYGPSDPDRVWKEWSPEVEAGVRKTLEANAELLAKIHELGELPLEDPSVMLYFSCKDAEATWECEVPNFFAIRAIQNLLVFESMLAAKTGDIDAAADAINMQVAWVRHFHSCKTDIIISSVSGALISICTRYAMMTLQETAFPEANARKLIQALGTVHARDMFASAWEHEREQKAIFFDTTPKDIWWITNRLTKFWLYRDYASLLRFMSRYADTVLLPYPQYKQAAEHLVEDIEWWALFTRMMMPNFERMMLRPTETDTMIEILRASIALRLYEADTGDFPETLSELVPQYLDRVPVDYFADGELGYRVDEDGAHFSSVGDDEADRGLRKQLAHHLPRLH